LSVLVAALTAPVRADEPAAYTPRAKGDLALKARHVLRTYCRECHSGQAGSRGRLVATDFDTLTRTDVPAAFVTPGKPGSQVLELIADGSMPPGGRKRPTPDEVQALREWVEAANAPAYPTRFDAADAAEVARSDFEQLPADEQRGARYVSFRHLLQDDAPPPNLFEAEKKLYQALAAASGGKLKGGVGYADPAATLIRLNVRPANWDDPNLFKVEFGPAAGGVADLTPFDLLLLDNPHAGLAPPRPGDKYLAWLRRTPFLRGDWLTDALADGAKPTPLADDLAALTRLSAEQERADPAKWTAGPAFRPLHKGGTLKGEAPPLGAWAVGTVTRDPPPFTLTAEAIDVKGAVTDAVKVRQPFRIRVRSSAAVFLELLQVYPTGSVDHRTLRGEFQRVAADTPVELTPDQRGGFSVDEIPGPAADAWVVLYASAKQGAVPTVVKSKHPASPIWRVYPTDAEAATAAVRVAVPLKVTK
jgi:hypothetical protein